MRSFFGVILVPIKLRLYLCQNDQKDPFGAEIVLNFEKEKRRLISF